MKSSILVLLSLFLTAVSLQAQGTFTAAVTQTNFAFTQGDPAVEATITVTHAGGTAGLILFHSNLSSVTSSPTSIYNDVGDVDTMTMTVDPTGLAPSPDPYTATIYLIGQGTTLAAAFSQEISITVNPGPSNTSDFDGDGNADLIFQNPAGQLEGWSMDGATVDSTFTLTPATAPTGFRLVGTGDFNADQRADLVFQNAAGRILIRLMNGTTSALNIPIEALPTSPDWKVKAVGDVNGDTISDIIFQAPDGRIEVWFMSGSERIGTSPLNDDLSKSPGWELVGAADFNGDYKTDFLFQSTSGQLVVWAMDGVNRMGPSIKVTPDAVGDPLLSVVSVDDLDGDGSPDITFQDKEGALEFWSMTGTTRQSTAPLSMDRAADPSFVVGNTGNRFSWPTLSVAPRTLDFGSLVAGEIQRRVVTVSNPGQGTLTIQSINLPAPFSAAWQTATIPSGGSRQLEITFAPKFSGDFTTSGVVIGNNFQSAAITLIGSAVNLASDLHPTKYDFNADGCSDFVWRNPATGGAWIQYLDDGKPKGGKPLSSIISLPWQQHAADFNGDGHADFLWRNANNGTMWIQYLKSGNPIGGKALAFSIGLPWELDIADLNRDGSPDLVWRNAVSGTTWVQFLKEGVQTGGKVLASAVANPWDLHVDDFNLDFHQDFLYRNPATGVTWIQYLRDGVVIGGKVLTVNASSPWEALVLDQNKDGHPDITWRNPNVGTLWIQYLRNGTPSGGKLLGIEIADPWDLLGSE